ncbi:RagB/SusD domain protein [Fibrella aestuarina BUZ 2]|uniref:RagB/SusD domain protein n=1 Tax=Fibrella aestuarina BUZ 2 TaxID=1166018 RepID=I0K995_9BACT|nr:RagB/SusD family nutrient uptake outer membrane protein [Fibrella aestuarina]CCH00698.1 RagB/SusD domain protein [Fibrella aestuarina BUZ 2]
MRTYKFILSTSLLAASVLAVTACKDSALLDVKPRSAADLATALTTPEGLDAAVNGIYERLQSTILYGRDFLAVSEALSDNAQFTNKSGRLVNENRNVAGATFGNWATSYFAINQANLILDNISTLTFAAADTARRNSSQGQAYFLRALLYHDLMRAYAYEPGVEVPAQNRGGVPLLLTGVADQSKITLPERPAIADVYKQIYTDLQSAISTFAKTNASAPAYGNRQAAQALFSRVALYNKDYTTAVKYATDAIAGSIKLSDNSSYVSGWRAPRHPESLFEIQYTTPENIGVNTSLQTTYTTLVRLGDRGTTGGFGDLVPTTAFIADLEAEKSATGAVLDIRRQLYELGTTGRGTAFIETTKFLGKNGTINLDNVPVIRISEVYLNRAEANYFLGNTADALADLNVIRVRSGLPAFPATITGAPLLAEIYRQARLEFGFEGHRWFDLKRTGQNVVKAAAQGSGLAYTDFRILAPIPVNELSTNKNIRQNFGY